MHKRVNLGEPSHCRFKFHKRRQPFIGMHNKSCDSTKALGFATGENPLD